MRKLNKPYTTIFLTLLMLLTLGGCLKTDVIHAHPDSPRFITGTFWCWARTAVYSRTDNVLLDAGWVSLGDMEGWTFFKEDWEAIIAEEAKSRKAP